MHANIILTSIALNQVNLEYYLKGNRFQNIFQEWVRYNTVLQHHPPSPCSISWYKYDHRTSEYMSIELQTPATDHHLQDEEKSDQMLKNIEQEIECPRCYDVMTLSSDFDRLGYTCQECDLLLIMK